MWDPLPPPPAFFLMPCIFIVFDFTFSKHALLFEENLFIRKYFQAYRKVASKKEISIYLLPSFIWHFTLNCLIVLLFAIDIASIFFWSIWGYIACIICVLFSLFYTKHRLLYILFCIWHFSLQLFHISSWRSSWVFFSFLFLFFLQLWVYHSLFSCSPQACITFESRKTKMKSAMENLNPPKRAS